MNLQRFMFWRRSGASNGSTTRQYSLQSVFKHAATGCGFLTLFFAVEAVFFAFQYYDAYRTVYPGSKVAQNLSGGKGTAFVFFKWLLLWVPGIIITGPIGFYASFHGVKGVAHEISKILACIIAIPWVCFCLFITTWQMWIYWVMLVVWSSSVWNHGCDGWDGYAMLEGVYWSEVSSTLPLAGTATVFLGAGSYTMQLRHQDGVPNVYTFYHLSIGDLPSIHELIAYDTANHTYTINNSTSRYTVKPNLAFPSLDISLEDDSIPFGSKCDMPLASLQYRNGSINSNVLNIINTDGNDCTKMKVCLMADHEGRFEIALGVVMIQQYLYGVCCSSPSDNSDNGDFDFTVSIGGS